MSRRRRKATQAVSLFPFLSILACVIGTLTLMITALALGQMDNDTVANAEKYEQVKNRLEAVRQLVERLKRKIQEVEQHADDTQKRLAEALLELERLKMQKEKLFEPDEKKKTPEVEIPTVDIEKHKQRLEQMQAELAEHEETKKELLAELKERMKPPEEAQVMIHPGGSGVNLDPTFVECTASGIVIYEGDEPTRVRAADLKTDKTFIGLLDRIAKQPNATVIFLIRDDALGTYYSARSIARAHYARNGKLPVIGHGKIDLSLFE